MSAPYLLFLLSFQLSVPLLDGARVIKRFKVPVEDASGAEPNWLLLPQVNVRLLQELDVLVLPSPGRWRNNLLGSGSTIAAASGSAM